MELIDFDGIQIELDLWEPGTGYTIEEINAMSGSCFLKGSKSTQTEHADQQVNELTEIDSGNTNSEEDD